jgi:hypothetical protein
MTRIQPQALLTGALLIGVVVIAVIVLGTGAGLFGGPTPTPTLTATPGPSETAGPSPTPIVVVVTATGSAQPTETPESPTAIPVTPTATVETPAASPTAGSVCGVESAPGLPGVDYSTWLIYCNQDVHFGFKYPPGGGNITATDTGVRIPLPFTPGTNLAEKYIEVAVLRDVSNCSSPLAEGNGNVKESQVTINGLVFKKQTGGDAGAGNIYEWEAYSTLRGDTCVSVGFVLHSTNPQNYPTPPAEFDRAAETAVYQAIMATVSWPQ